MSAVVARFCFGEVVHATLRTPMVDTLLERARTGEREAWEKLIALHSRRILLVLLSRGVRVSRAEEIVQETWEKLIAKSKEGSLERLELPGLAITQATNLALDDARRERVRRAASLEESSEAQAVADPKSDVLERLVSRQAVERALAELEACPPRAREVFSAVYENPELPHEVTAKKLGLSVQRVRQTLCDVRARLRAKMED